ncbi:hypothetical protein AB0J86_36785 [Micromonospora sp. NPDC049559]|uniref:hypothetical protein n=1 Tax=Micromonospora sp. NPDC049559 TaxID=3155923 RepID=UPI003437D7CF
MSRAHRGPHAGSDRTDGRRTGLANALLAGVAATLARELVSSLDMAVRGRPYSDTHERMVRRIADGTHVSVGTEKPARHRLTGLGFLLGFANGVLTVTAFALLTGRRRPPLPAAAALVGAGGMLVADAPMAALGVASPRRWGAQGWFEDGLPYVAYSLVAVTTLDRLERARARR